MHAGTRAILMALLSIGSSAAFFSLIQPSRWPIHSIAIYLYFVNIALCAQSLWNVAFGAMHTSFQILSPDYYNRFSCFRTQCILRISWLCWNWFLKNAHERKCKAVEIQQPVNFGPLHSSVQINQLCSSKEFGAVQKRRIKRIRRLETLNLDLSRPSKIYYLIFAFPDFLTSTNTTRNETKSTADTNFKLHERYFE